MANYSRGEKLFDGDAGLDLPDRYRWGRRAWKLPQAGNIEMLESRDTGTIIR